ncbi:unnamed protein product [Spirodela intermedia]|uniref:Uncharacterized protein n=2 Tax=Spirodela intermedia TaxID=51605 RepID=A0A7I8JGY9_SPIIN|nr:unnamed protein product [Spirodela intermedia]CAA6669429.1 unnamed protein product [Spirodela intermedia]CAA7406385.1 unnamed protein product [Spirodela intermedia]
MASTLDNLSEQVLTDTSFHGLKEDMQLETLHLPVTVTENSWLPLERANMSQAWAFARIRKWRSRTY